MPIIQMDSPFNTGMSAGASVAKEAFNADQARQTLALAKLKQDQDNTYNMGILGVDQGRLANDTTLLPHQIAQTDADTGFKTAQTAGQSIANTWTPRLDAASLQKTNSDIGVQNAQAVYYRALGGDEQAKTQWQQLQNKYGPDMLRAQIFKDNATGQSALMEGGAAQTNAAGAFARDTANAALLNTQNEISKRMGVFSKNGNVNASNAWQILAQDPYAKSLYESFAGQDPRLIAASPAFNRAEPASQAAIMTLLNQPLDRKYDTTPLEQEHQSGAALNSLLNLRDPSGVDLGTRLNSVDPAMLPGFTAVWKAAGVRDLGHMIQSLQNIVHTNKPYTLGQGDQSLTLTPKIAQRWLDNLNGQHIDAAGGMLPMPGPTPNPVP